MLRPRARLIAAVVIGLLVLAGSVYAESSRQMTLGVFGGLSLAKIRGADLSGSLTDLNLGFNVDENYDPFYPDFTDPRGDVYIDDVTLGGLSTRTGASFGAFLNVPIADQISIQPEVHYVPKGSKQDWNVDATVVTGGFLDIPVSIPGTLKWKFNYIQIPVLLKYAIPTEGSVAPSIFGGPALAIRTSSKLGIDVAGFGGADVDIKNFIKSTELGLVFGAGLDFSMSPTTILNLDARYNLGMSSLLDVPAYASYFVPDLKNSGFEFRLGFGFLLGQ